MNTKAKGWMNTENVNQTEYLKALKRRITAHENQEQWRKKLGKSLTLSQIGLEKDTDGICTEGDALSMTGRVKNGRDSLKLAKGLKFTPAEDILDLLNKLAGTNFTTVEQVRNGGNSIDWAFAASILDLTQFVQRKEDGDSYLGVSSAGRVYRLNIYRDRVDLNSLSYYYNYGTERLVLSEVS